MKLTYDPRYNIAYIRFREKAMNIQAIRISDELIIDLAPDGRLYGIELLNANEQLQPDTPDNTLLVVNEATGEEVGIPLLL